MAEVSIQPVGRNKKVLIDAAARRLKGKRARPVAGGRLKGKYIGKERYKGLTKGTPKGKYKGKYIGPDRFKGDAAAYQKYKDEKAAKRKQKLIPPGEIGTRFPKDRVGIPPGEIGKKVPLRTKKRIRQPYKKGEVHTQPVGVGVKAPI